MNTTILLQKNQVYHFYSSGAVDMTGEKVTSTKPVALFSGSVLGNTPGGLSVCPGIGTGSEDHTYEQLWSTEKWGKDFLVFPILTPGGAGNWGGILALVADENETTVTLSGGINGGAPLNYTLNAGEKQYVCFAMSGLTKIVSNKPIMVFLILPDATVTNIVPTNQRIQQAIVAPFILTGNTNINQHGIDMLVPQAYWNQTVIKENGAVVSNATYTVNPSIHSPDWYHVRKHLPNVNVTIEITCDGGFLAYMSGNGVAESYAFVAGTGAFDLQNYFTIQEKATTIDTYYENTTELTHTFTASDIIVVKRTVEKSFTSIKWLINEIPYSIAENLNSTNELNFPASALSSGENFLTMSVRYAGATQDSLYIGKVWLASTLFCGGSGTEIDPYLICTAAQLDSVRHFLNKHFKLANDIPLSAYLAPGGEGHDKWDSEGWEPIGNDITPFTGSLNGDGHKIIGLWINRTGDYIGLFGFIDGAVIRNVGLILKRE